MRCIRGRGFAKANILGLLAVAGCAGSGPLPVAPSQAARSDGPGLPSVQGAAAQLPAAPSVREPERFDFHVVVQGGGPAEVVAGDGGGLVLARNAIVELDADAATTRYKPYGGDALPPAAGGYASGWTIRFAGGHWPESVFMSDYMAPGQCGTGELPPGLGIVGWTEHHWKAFDPPLAGSIEAWSRWLPGTSLAVGNEIPYMVDAQAYFFRVLGKASDRPAPSPAAAPPNTTTPSREEWSRFKCGTRLGSAASISALPTGEVFVLGTECATDAAAVEWWDADSAEHFDGMPRAPKGIMNLQRASVGHWPVLAAADGSIVARSPREVYVGGSNAGRAYLAEFDGREWRALDAPMRSAITSMEGLAGASLWATTVDGELWRKPDGGDWRRVDLGSHKARKVRVGSPADVWVVSDDAVLRSVALAPALTLASADPEHPEQEWSREAAKESCPSIFVGLYTVAPDDTKSNRDFPRTRAILRGHPELAASRFVVTNTATFGAIVDDLGAAKHVADVFRAGKPGTSPNILCETPVVVREMRFSWAGDEVVQAADL